MRTLIVAMGLAALAAAPAIAQTGLSRGSSTGTATSAGTTGSTGSTTTTPSTSVGGEAVLTAPASTGGGSSTVAGGGDAFGTNIATPPADPTNSRPSFGPGGRFSDDIVDLAPPVGDGAPTLVPEGNVSVIGGGGVGTRLSGASPSVTLQAQGGAAASTPLFDQAAREGRAREARRRARGEEPRVYGIAPNTERDLTWQMPDDPIIRY